MGYYLIKFSEDTQNWKLDELEQLKEGLSKVFPTINGCGQIGSVKQLTDNDIELTMLQEMQVEGFFSNVK